MLLLQYKNSSRRFFYWLQDVDGSKDADVVSEMNELLNKQNSAGGDGENSAGDASGGASSQDAPSLGGGGTDATMADASGVSSPSSALSTSALTGALNPATGSSQDGPAGDVGSTPAPALDFLGGAAAAPSASQEGGGKAALTLESLQGALGNLGGVLSTSRVKPTSLQSILNSRAVVSSGILDDPSVSSGLLPLLPAGQQTPELLLKNIRSPQLSQAIITLSSSLLTSPETFDAILANFKLQENDKVREKKGQGQNVIAFLEAVIAKHMK